MEGINDSLAVFSERERVCNRRLGVIVIEVLKIKVIIVTLIMYFLK